MINVPGASSSVFNTHWKDVESDWLADLLDERGALGHAQIHKGNTKGDDPEIAPRHNAKILDRGLCLKES